jgi:hypothetical protein
MTVPVDFLHKYCQQKICKKYFQQFQGGGIAINIWGCHSRWRTCEWQHSTHISVASGLPHANLRLHFFIVSAVFRATKGLLMVWKLVTLITNRYFLFWFCIHA